jgi:glycine/D-amino acid oxidase-like deaminating enzyme
MYNTEVSKLIVKPEEELGLSGEPFVWQKKKIVEVASSSGKINAKKIVLAVGAWANTLLAPIGLESFQSPKKRQMFAFKDPRLKQLFEIKGFNEQKVMPLTILPIANIHFRSEPSEGSIWLACADDLGRKFELEEDPQAEDDYYFKDIYNILIKYFPCFLDVRPINKWAGEYSINSFDETPVIYENSGLYYVGAASGSGIMKADSLGRILDALVTGDEEAELFGGIKFKVSDLGIKHRQVEHEEFVI